MYLTLHKCLIIFKKAFISFYLKINIMKIDNRSTIYRNYRIIAVEKAF